MPEILRYTKQFAEVLPNIFEKRAYFSRFGPKEAYDGVTDNDVAFTLKTSDIPVVIRDYNTGANVAFGTGTSNSSRFGALTEVKYTNTNVNFTSTWAFNEGLDRFTVNADLERAVAERLREQGEALTARDDMNIANYISTNGTISEQLEFYSAVGVLALFNALDKTYTNLKVIGTKVAAVNSDIYNLIIEHPLTVKEKNGNVNVDNNTVFKFKDFVIEKIPDSNLPAGTIGLVYVENMGKTYTGIVETRAFESTDFVGTQLQGAGKDGVYTHPRNYTAMGKITAPAVGG